MADRSMDFTGNNDWAQMGHPIDPTDHPANNMPSATEDHWGTVNDPMDYVHKPADLMIKQRLAGGRSTGDQGNHD